MVDLDNRPIGGLKAIGIVDGNSVRWNAPESQVANIIQQSKRYDVQRSTEKVDDLATELKKCEIEIRAAIQSIVGGHKRLEVLFRNKSSIPIPLVGAKIEWCFDPPRLHVAPPDSKIEVALSSESMRPR